MPDGSPTGAIRPGQRSPTRSAARLFPQRGTGGAGPRSWNRLRAGHSQSGVAQPSQRFGRGAAAVGSASAWPGSERTSTPHRTPGRSARARCRPGFVRHAAIGCPRDAGSPSCGESGDSATQTAGTPPKPRVCTPSSAPNACQKIPTAFRPSSDSLWAGVRSQRRERLPAPRPGAVLADRGRAPGSVAAPLRPRHGRGAVAPSSFRVERARA
jgi:hypothetical protein